MRIEQLEYLTTITRLGSFRRAAEELHLSQPALSATVRNLERELGVTVLERTRSGTKLSDAGRELLPHMLAVLDSADRLRRTADARQRTSRTVRLGTVSTATTPLVIPAIRRFRETDLSAQIEVMIAQQDQIHRGLVDGSFDLGLVNYMDGDDFPPDLETTVLLRAPAAVCLHADDPYAEQSSISTAELLRMPLIGMRAGFLMNRYLHRLLGSRLSSFAYTADGAEMGKLLVAEGLGATVLPRFSIVDDPLHRLGVLVDRPIADDATEVLLVVQRPRSSAASPAPDELHRILVERARELEAAPSPAVRPPSPPT